MIRTISIQRAIASGRLRPKSNRRSVILALGTGQSNMSNWSSPTFHASGEVQLLATLNANNTGSNGFINAGNGASFLSRKAFNAAKASS